MNHNTQFTSANINNKVARDYFPSHFEIQKHSEMFDSFNNKNADNNSASSNSSPTVKQIG